MGACQVGRPKNVPHTELHTLPVLQGKKPKDTQQGAQAHEAAPGGRCT